MASNLVKPLRCAIYTRKSTERGLELEFNSLHAQREACEAYIKSQASLGWRCLTQSYDDAAFSGGTLERPALKRLLKDTEDGEIDVIVVYKIDRLTRSLADFAKLVEVFDARSISFVAVTQQFNTTTSMGRLTLNVLLSFAQFERELSSERVRDKIAASRQKGKWTGGTVPLGYDVKDKKLVPHPIERKTVEYIFKRYLELKGFQKLIADLDGKGIVTKQRKTDIKKYKGGIPFTYGPLAYLLKNRLYIGEMAHKDKWYAGEHHGILEPKIFNRVQALLKSHKVERRVKRTQSGALLMGKLYDDKGNVMSPTYSTKKGVRYRFYVSSALLKGRKADAGSISRVSATAIEATVADYIRSQHTPTMPDNQSFSDLLDQILIRVDVRKTSLRLTLNEEKDDEENNFSSAHTTINLIWTPETQRSSVSDKNDGLPDPQMLHAVVRAHAWIKMLEDGTHKKMEALAKCVKLNPNVVREAIKLAYLDPSLTENILTGSTKLGLNLRQLRECDEVVWRKQRRSCRAD